jgi:hypothetical protein
MERRELVQIMVGTALAGPFAEAQHQRDAGPQAHSPYTPRFFDAGQYRMLDELCELLLPADDSGPGAREAGVAGFVDTVLLYADADTQQRWRAGLAAVEAAAQREFGKGFLECDAGQHAAIMNLLAENESNPETELQRFFGALKRAAIEGFGLSEAGKRALGYRGNTAVAGFQGCTHPEHQP